MSKEGRGNGSLGICIKRNPIGTPPIIALLWWALECVHRERRKEAATVRRVLEVAKTSIIALLWWAPVCIVKEAATM